MSTTIDERVVEMRFDNKQFESNVATSMSTLEKLKKSLNLTGASKGLEDVGTATKRVDMSGLGGAVDSVKAKFSALQVVGVTALANITNSAVNAGKSIIKSLTIDPVKTGFDEYETKMGSIQTILANTEHQGTTLNDVTAALDKLNLYADKTIYNFKEMTRNIGTFTAAGIDLETSVRSIQGIANLAAISGSTSQQASTAMYQLSQALATGTVKLQDWNSVVNAGMGGKVFQNALIQTAAVLDGAGDDVAAWQAKNIDAFGSFRESLSRGAWLTSEVLTRTLEQFTMAAEEGSETWEEYKKSLMDTGYTEAQAESILKMANTASDAATKVKTFTQLMDTLKESAQSGWAQSWEIIIGDFEEAKAVFTELSDLLGGVIGKSADRRNSFLSEVFTSNWDKLISRINEAGVETEQFEGSLRKVAGDDKLDSLIEKYGSLKDVFRSGALDAKYLKEALEELGVAGKEAGEAGKEAGEKIKKGLSVDLTNFFKKDHAITLSYDSPDAESVKKIQTALTELGFELPVNGIFKAETRKAVTDFQKSVGLAGTGVVDQRTIDALIKAGESLERVSEASEHIGEASEAAKVNIDDLVDGIGKLSGRELLFNTIRNSLEAIIKVIGTFRDGWSEIFTTDRMASGLYNALDALHSFSEKLIISDSTANKLKSTFKGVIAIFDILTSIVGGALKAGFDILSSVLDVFGFDVLNITRSIGDVIVAFRDWIAENDVISEMFGKIVEIAKSGIKIVKDWINSFAKLPIVSDVIKEIRRAFIRFSLSAKDMDHAMKKVVEWFESLKDLSIVQLALEKTKSAFDSFNKSIPKAVDAICKWFDAFKQTDGVQKLISAVEGLIEAFKKLFSGELDSSEFATELGKNLGKAVASLPEIAAQIAKDFIAGFQNGISDSVSGVISSIVEFCANFVAAFASALGIHSPSVISYEDGTNFIQGFIDGLKAMLGSVVSVLKKIGEVIVKVFKSLWDSITDENGDIEWGKIFAAGILISAVWFLKQIATAFSGIAKAFGSIDDLIAGVNKVLTSFSKVLNSVAWDIKAQAIKKMAIAVAILAATVLVLSQVKDEDVGKLWNAVGVVFALAAILVGLAFALQWLSKTSATFDLANKKFDISGLKTSLLQIALAILLVTASVKLLGGIDDTEAKKGFERLAVIAVGMLVFIEILGAILNYSGDVSGIGGMMLKLSAVMILMVGVCKLASKLSGGEMFKGAAFATGFVIFVKFLVKALSIGNDKQLAKVGGLLLSISLAMTLMVGVCKLASKLSGGEILKGAAFAAGFVVFVKFLVKVLTVGKDSQLAKVAGLILSVSFSLALMVGVCKLASALRLEEVLAGAAFVAGFVFLLKCLVKVLAIGDKQTIANVASTLLAMSVAIAIMAAVAVALSFIPLRGLAKGIIAVGLLSGMMALMAKSLKGAQNAKGAIMMMAIAIGIMAAAVAALSFIDTGKVIANALAMSAMMVAFAFMIKCLKGLKTGQAIKGALSLLALMVPLVTFVGILYLLDGVEGSTEKIISLTAAIAAFTIMAVVLSAVGHVASRALKGVGALLLLMGPLYVFVKILQMLDGVEDIKDKIISLVAAMGAMTLLLGVLTVIGKGGFAAIIGIGSLLALGTSILAVGAVFEKWPDLLDTLDIGIEVFKKIGSLAESMGAMAGFLGALTAIGLGGPAAIIGIGSLLALGASLLAVGAIIDEWPFLLDKIEIGIEVFGKIAGAIGAIFGNMVSSFGTTASDGFAEMCSDLSTAMDDMVAVSDKAKKIDTSSFTVISDIIGALADIGSLSIKTGFDDAFVKLFSWDKDMSSVKKFAEDGTELFEALGEISSAAGATTINTDAIKQLTGVATDLNGLRKDITTISSFGEFIGIIMGQSMANFGADCSKFIQEMVTGFSALKDENGANLTLNTTAMTDLIKAGNELAKLKNEIGNISSLGDLLKEWMGTGSLETFGADCSAFISELTTGFSALKDENGANVDLNVSGLATIITEAGKLNEFQNDITNIQSFSDFIAKTFTSNALSKFGTNCSDFIASLTKAFSGLKDENGADVSLNLTAFENLVTAAEDLNELQASLDGTNDIIAWFEGKQDLTGFAEGVKSFGSSMSEFAESLSDFSTDKINLAIGVANGVKDLAIAVEDVPFDGISDLLYDGVLADLGGILVAFNESITGIDVKNVSIAVTATTRLKTLIAGLSELDASGVDNFKPVPVGEALSEYSTSVVSLNIAAIDESIAAANKIKAFISGLSSFKTGGIDSFKSAVDNLSTVNLSGVSDMMTEYTTTMQTSGVTLANSLNSGLQSGLGVIKNTIKTVLSKAISSVGSRASGFRTAGRLLSSNLASGISSGGGTAASAASSIASSAANSARGKYTSFYAAGAYLVYGFCNGISENTFRAEAKAAAMAKAAYEAARKELDVNSPSKVFKRLGTSVPEGFAIGLSMLGNEVESSSSDMASVAINTTRDAMATVLNTLNTDINSQPTIRPIMDLSDVKTGADAIRGMFSGVQTIGVRSNLNAINASINRTLQNGSNDDIISAINKLNDNLGNVRGDTYTVGNVTYDDGSNVSDAIKTIVRYARIGGRV